MQILGTHHLAITTSRFERLRQFYVETLGLPVVGSFPDYDIVFIEAVSTTIELIGEVPAPEVDGSSTLVVDVADPPPDDATPESRAARHGWHHLAWEVQDVEATFAELIARGVSVHAPPESFPETAPTMRIAFLRDPDGNLLELVQPLGARFPAHDADVARLQHHGF